MYLTKTCQSLIWEDVAIHTEEPTSFFYVVMWYWKKDFSCPYWHTHYFCCGKILSRNEATADIIRVYILSSFKNICFFFLMPRRTFLWVRKCCKICLGPSLLPSFLPSVSVHTFPCFFKFSLAAVFTCEHPVAEPKEVVVGAFLQNSETSYTTTVKCSD